MTDLLDLGPATRRMAELIAGIVDDDLAAPTPCNAYTLGDLLDHVGGLTVAFTRAAAKDTDSSGDAPSGDVARLGDDWRTRIPVELDALATAWGNPAAWTGMTQAGGIDMPGDMAGVVAIEELVVHGWDIARASGQIYEPDLDAIDVALGFVEQFSGPDDAESRGDAYGPVVLVPADAPPLDRLIGLTGRDPTWSPPMP